MTLGSGRVPLVSTLIAMQQCQAQLGGLGATFPLSIGQLECLKLYAGDDALQALATAIEPPEHIEAAFEVCAIDLSVLRGE